MLNFHDLRFFPMFFPCLQMFSDFSRMFSPSFSMELPPFCPEIRPRLPGSSAPRCPPPWPAAWPGADPLTRRRGRPAWRAARKPRSPGRWARTLGTQLRKGKTWGNHGKRCENHGTCVRGNGKKWRKNREKQKESGWSLDSYDGNIMKYMGIMLMPQFRNAKLVICNSLYLDSGL